MKTNLNYATCLMLLAGLGLAGGIHGQTKEAPASKAGKKPVGQENAPVSASKRKLSADDVIRLALTSGYEMRIKRLEREQADTNLKKAQSPYSFKVFGGYSGSHVKDKESSSTILTGTESYTDTYTAGISKQFSTGTYFELSGSDTRFDSNAGDNPAAQSIGLGSLSQPPLHTAALSVTLRQELLKNAFGYNERRRLRGARIGSLIEKDNNALAMSTVIVSALVDYWNLAVADRNLESARALLTNTQNVRGITARKARLGLADRFELYQWNSLVHQATTALNQAKLERKVQAAALARSLGLEQEIESIEAPALADTVPADLEVERDLKMALEQRREIRNIHRRIRLARLDLEMAKNSQLPSITLGGTYASRDQASSSRTAFSDDLRRGLYPESRIDFRIEMPLFDPGTKADVRNAKLAQRKLGLELSRLQREITDELRLGMERVQLGLQSLKAARDSEKQSQAYYYGLLQDYTRGRSSAVAIKSALDALIDAGNRLTRELVNFNISVIRYDLARANVLKKYGVKIEE